MVSQNLICFYILVFKTGDILACGYNLSAKAAFRNYYLWSFAINNKKNIILDWISIPTAHGAKTKKIISKILCN